MLGLVRVALKRPYTFVVMALLILIVGPLAALRTPVDIFPEIRIPVIAVVWQYTGLPPDQMSGRVMLNFQRALTTTVNDIEHIEGTSYTGVGIVKIFFQPGVDISIANAQVTAIAQTVLRQMPPNITPPLILNYNAATVPIIQLALAGKGVPEQAVFDLAINTVRTPLVTVPGAAIPFPFGGKFRQIQIDLDPAALQARGLSAADVANALAAQNLLTPVGTQKIGGHEYAIQLNNAPADFNALADIPVFAANGTVVYLRDVAQVRDGNPPQQNIVHVDGGRSVLLAVLKNGTTSTLAIIAGIKERVAELKKVLPANVSLAVLGDQSLFVEGAVSGVAHEAVLAAVLTSLMILLFLGSWRSTVIIAISIPLAILGSIALLAAFGETLNIMTLGGLALAVGILVDDATVTIENINWHLEQGKDVETAIMDGARQIVTPAFVSLLCICIVFVPMFFLEGVARFLFVPMAMAVIFAMVCSFILSRTLVPTMANFLLKPHGAHSHGEAPPPSRNPLVRFQRGFEARFERLRAVYHDLLGLALARRGVFIVCFMAFVLGSFALVPFLGRNFFPTVDSGQILMHVRAPIGTRVEETANSFVDIQKAIRTIIPPSQIATMADNVGMPVSGINMAYNNTGTIGPQDGDIQIKLTPDHRPTEEYVAALRERLPELFPGFTFSFLPADIISQILNFGAPSPIDVQVRTSDTNAGFEHANRLLARIRQIPGVVDARIQQSRGAPVFAVDIDRSRAQTVGLTTRDVTNSLVVNLAGSSQVAPTYWLNPANGVTYNIVMQTPQYRLDSLASLSNLPIMAPAAAQLQVLGGVADIKRSSANAVVSQYDLQGMVQVYAGVQGRDLGAVAADVRAVVAELAPQQSPRIRSVKVQGQVKTMESAFSGLLFGLLGAVVLIYLLIVVNFQSWSDPFVIITALPAALAGIVWMLFATGTTLSVPALTGAIMCMGVATANSVLVISFARERLLELGDATAAALDAGVVRFRPVIMTALAMIIGMTPMALGMGEGGEQNAPLGRAVIGGLVFATIATLMFVPVVFSVVHRNHGKAPPAARAPVPGAPHVA
ncbi:efflux RND transporter permease subunit [Reyranella aquatilis]|uniref:Efflux RND transporter permease subunit n=1 Tax=Reyranella aquatilis TaxID=2035356 RepID=A0ABS8KYL9_9HYPH|nr:efflux RND transporter permease subunit [Reyranella aquatilis]MCC8431160.1 efflux RND transporter permease subunit [Reyranella aquatilis]